MPMRAGLLKHKIAILREQETRDEFGGVISDGIPSTVLSPRCAVRSMGTEEKTAAGIETNKTAFVFTIRHRNSIQMTDLVLYRNNTYDIRDLKDETQERVMLEIHAELVE